MSTGFFIAPKTGIYHFTFSGIRDKDSENTWVELRRNIGRNSEKIATAYGDHSLPYATISFTATIKLQKGDIITLLNSGKGVLYDDDNLYTTFTGSLLMDKY